MDLQGKGIPLYNAGSPSPVRVRRTEIAALPSEVGVCLTSRAPALTGTHPTVWTILEAALISTTERNALKARKPLPNHCKGFSTHSVFLKGVPSATKKRA